MLSKRFYGAALMAAMVGVPALAACSSDNPLCCTEFKVGATLDASIGGSAQSQVAAQAVADIGGIASAAVDDLTTACRGIAQDMGAAQADQDSAEGNSDKNKKMQAWCALAVSSIKGAVSAGITIALTVQPPQCSASISAKANCQAQCSGSAKCDVQANPPKCTGGQLVVDCKGSCTGSAGASVSCTGSCSGNCSGDCTASGGVAVDCQGKCDGTCAAGGSANGSGIQADGTCKGTCQGTCHASATAPAVKCSGSCNGKCDATCMASANASVKCDGTCMGSATPISCTGGKLEGGCQVDAKCDANCDASVSAKAECTPPQIALTLTGSADATIIAKLQATLEANLPIVFSIKAKLEGVATATASFTGNISAVTDIKAACIPIMIQAAGDAIGQVTVSVQATADVTGAVGSK